MNAANIFKDGAGAVFTANGAECVFLVAATNSVGDITQPVRAERFYANAAWKALDMGEREFGNCKIVNSAIASDYAAYCEEIAAEMWD